MSELTEAQRAVLRKMRGYRVVARLETGAVLIASPANRRALVIDTDGRQFYFRHYLEQLGRNDEA